MANRSTNPELPLISLRGDQSPFEHVRINNLETDLSKVVKHVRELENFINYASRCSPDFERLLIGFRALERLEIKD